MLALRETITNAVMHRDWFFDGTNVFVEIYTDRIEVVSPGSLPKSLTLGARATVVMYPSPTSSIASTL